MENASYIALSRQIAVQRNLDIVANNIANANTTGFKAQNMLFEEFLLDDHRSKVDDFDMVNDYGQYTNTSNGDIQMTGNDFDLALQGDALFRVTTPQGDRYTRAGSFQLNEIGEIVTHDGFPLTTATNAPIRVPIDTTSVKITKDGAVYADGDQVGQIALFDFDSYEDLLQTGENLYSSEKAPTASTTTNVIQGGLESSNVSPILEMTQLISLSRTHESAQNMIKLEHERIRGAIKILGNAS
ncbi:MAG: flagellar basal-body rod protein FlgF [Micavibrio sp.]|nr:flagellar basal-body rod protein FlgF [Micavibrio sp.]|tara:strand:- start:3472 stop:4197 length:726 start_codon:yes stop_codon:yes gene_type:complete